MIVHKYLFEIPVYRLSESAYYKRLTEYKRIVNAKMQSPLSDGYLHNKFGGDWRYNEIIGFLRFYRYGSNQIRCEYWETDTQKKIRTRKKQFILLSDSYCKELFSTLSSNSDLSKTMKSAVNHCEIRLRKKNRVLDKELFDSMVDFIDWKSLLI